MALRTMGVFPVSNHAGQISWIDVTKASFPADLRGL